MWKGGKVARRLQQNKERHFFRMEIKSAECEKLEN